MKKYLLLGLSVLVIVLIGAIFSVSSMEKSSSNILRSVDSYGHVPPALFSQALNSGRYILIDVRTIDEYNAGHIANAKQADYYQAKEFSQYLDSLNKNVTYLIYCRTGRRSAAALQIMRDKGFKQAYDLAGGYNAWVSSNLPVE